MTELPSTSPPTATRTVGVLARLIVALGAALLFVGVVWFRYFSYSRDAYVGCFTTMFVGAILVVSAARKWTALFRAIRDYFRFP